MNEIIEVSAWVLVALVAMPLPMMLGLSSTTFLLRKERERSDKLLEMHFQAMTESNNFVMREMESRHAAQAECDVWRAKYEALEAEIEAQRE